MTKPQSDKTIEFLSKMHSNILNIMYDQDNRVRIMLSKGDTFVIDSEGKLYKMEIIWTSKPLPDITYTEIV